MQIYAVSITIRIVVRMQQINHDTWDNNLVIAYCISECLVQLQLGFVLLASIWEYDFPPFMVLIIAILNDGNVLLQYL
jgi:hypothetical protein